MCKVKSAAQIANEFDELERLEEMPYEDLTAEDCGCLGADPQPPSS